MNRLFITVLLIFMALNMQADEKRTVELKFVETSDVHGMFFPTNYMTGKPVMGSMARISSYIKQQRKQYGDRLILLDNGDILQGQPTNYYWNFINTQDENIASSIVNYLGYDAQTFGNHDVETGHAVYDKWMKELKCPVLGANILDTKTNEPYVKPYVIIEREGVRIAVLGMTTPAIPNWLSNDIWSGMKFEEMIASAQKWIKHLREVEKAKVILGLFHAGKSGGIKTPEYEENAVEAVAKAVPGFDVIFYGHDHQSFRGYVDVNEYEACLLVNPGNNAHKVGEVTMTIDITNERLFEKEIQGKLVSVDDLPVDEDFMNEFAADITSLKEFTSKQIGTFDNAIYAKDSFFGNSAFCDLVHNVQLSVTEADVSLHAPLFMNSEIKKGPITMADMFTLYKYEDKLHVLRMTGAEIRKYLEMSYALWTNQMTSDNDHLLLLKEDGKQFKNLFYYFDSAAGIVYDVDVTKPAGEKVTIKKMSNGKPFAENAWYKVVMNSYRSNGGGELITLGAGIPKEEIESRIVSRSELDVRNYLMKEIERRGKVSPKPNNNWKFVPEKWVKKAAERDKALLFK